MTVEDVLEFLEEHREHNVLRSGITLGSIRDYMGKCIDAKVDAKLEIAALTARAEQAERERDAFMKECDTGRTAGYKEGLEEGYKKGRDEGYDTAWKEARYEMNEY